jgi:hypothetical protein
MICAKCGKNWSTTSGSGEEVKHVKTHKTNDGQRAIKAFGTGKLIMLIKQN